MSNELWRMTAVDLAHAIRLGAVSSREATLSVLARIDAVNPVLNAVVDQLPEQALAAAEEDWLHASARLEAARVELQEEQAG